MRLITLSLALSVCAGQIGAQVLQDNLTVTSATQPPYQANVSLTTSGTVSVNSATTTTYAAGQLIQLMPGFTATAAAGTTPSFLAAIVPPPFYPNTVPTGETSGAGQNFVLNIPTSASDPVTGIYILFNWAPTAVDVGGCGG